MKLKFLVSDKPTGVKAVLYRRVLRVIWWPIWSYGPTHQCLFVILQQHKYIETAYPAKTVKYHLKSRAYRKFVMQENTERKYS